MFSREGAPDGLQVGLEPRDQHQDKAGEKEEGDSADHGSTMEGNGDPKANPDCAKTNTAEKTDERK